MEDRAVACVDNAVDEEVEEPVVEVHEFVAVDMVNHEVAQLDVEHDPDRIDLVAQVVVHVDDLDVVEVVVVEAMVKLHVPEVHQLGSDEKQQIALKQLTQVAKELRSANLDEKQQEIHEVKTEYVSEVQVTEEAPRFAPLE